MTVITITKSSKNKRKKYINKKEKKGKKKCVKKVKNKEKSI